MDESEAVPGRASAVAHYVAWIPHRLCFCNPAPPCPPLVWRLPLASLRTRSGTYCRSGPTRSVGMIRTVRRVRPGLPRAPDAYVDASLHNGRRVYPPGPSIGLGPVCLKAQAGDGFLPGRPSRQLPKPRRCRTSLPFARRAPFRPPPPKPTPSATGSATWRRAQTFRSWTYQTRIMSRWARNQSVLIQKVTRLGTFRIRRSLCGDWDGGCSGNGPHAPSAVQGHRTGL